MYLVTQDSRRMDNEHKIKQRLRKLLRYNRCYFTNTIKQEPTRRPTQLLAVV